MECRGRRVADARRAAVHRHRAAARRRPRWCRCRRQTRSRPASRRCRPAAATSRSAQTSRSTWLSTCCRTGCRRRRRSGCRRLLGRRGHHRHRRTITLAAVLVGGSERRLVRPGGRVRVGHRRIGRADDVLDRRSVSPVDGVGEVRCHVRRRRVLGAHLDRERHTDRRGQAAGDHRDRRRVGDDDRADRCLLAPIRRSPGARSDKRSACSSRRRCRTTRAPPR